MRSLLVLLIAGAACGSSQEPTTTSPAEPARIEPAKPVEPPVEPEPAFQPVVHTFSADAGGIRANAYLVETKEGVVVVDGGLRVSDGKAIKARLDEIGKPLLSVLITHGHPDHYNGVTEIVAGAEVPVVAAKGVDEVIRRDDAAKEKQWKGMFGDEWPAERTFPSRIAEDGEAVAFGGVTFTPHDLGPGESHHDTYWSADLGETGKVAFIGDVVLHGVHAYVADGHTSAWLANLERLEQELGDYAILYPGHGEPGGAEILGWQKSYLEAYRAAVQKLAKGKAKLNEGQKKKLVGEMKKHHDSDELEFLIALGADPVAAELAAEKKAKKKKGKK